MFLKLIFTVNKKDKPKHFAQGDLFMLSNNDDDDEYKSVIKSISITVDEIIKLDIMAFNHGRYELESSKQVNKETKKFVKFKSDFLIQPLNKCEEC